MPDEEMADPDYRDGDEPRFALAAASTVVMRKVRWLWHERIPLGEITLIVGREGVGKSTYLADLAAKITKGEAPGEYEGKAKAVIYIASEDSWSYAIAPRLTAAQANLDRVYRIRNLVEYDGLTLPRDITELGRMARDVDAAAIMCDPMVSLIDDRLSVDKTRELRKALEPLRRVAEQSRCAVPALVHFNKRDGDTLSRIAGARGWAEVARAAIGMIRDTDNGHCVLSQIKNNLGRIDLAHHSYHIVQVDVMTADGPAPIGRIEWLGKVEQGIDDIYDSQRGGARGGGSDGGRGRGRPRSAETSEIVQAVLNNGQMTVQEAIAAFPDLEERLVRNALASGVQSGLISRPRKGVYGKPPGDDGGSQDEPRERYY